MTQSVIPSVARELCGLGGARNDILRTTRTAQAPPLRSAQGRDDRGAR